ncbi:HAD family hydrolase [Desulforhopalus singaporensis]|uniref:phosphoglycolate phosphatase n=1 Tax=Desulforhopalus singaporensis TaxID=91360 RepID=A0A1H0JSN9_9BACT|nr:HAD-IA family hydrolase [Desulforhopalus singaporensis]SDO46746.1 haloacid dehalogenase superfamily, subfamily IA, variant 3 with third motif having DD or ED/haloacid dehalogenase superfamily, subfamily IA, variant 1 with third motif having Dx(3-4)D or Dx(3-4)E [Desulforhopalus singaporensis]
MLKLIVFDCDGVMFDSKQANIAYYNHLLDHFGLPKMDSGEEDYVHMSSVIEAITRIFSRHRSPNLDQVHEYRLQITYEPFLQHMKMEPDLVYFLERVWKKYRLAISTNRTNTMLPLLESHNLDHYFEKVVTAATAKRPKPAPDGLLEILDHFNCAPEEALFIGDSIVDQQHASACGVDLIAFKNSDLEARYHVDSFKEILQLPPFGRS